MIVRFLALLLALVGCCAAADNAAERIARAAKEAEDSNQIVRAYLLYAAAAARDPQNASYRANRDALQPAAKLLSKASIQTADVSKEVADMDQQPQSAEPPVELVKEADWEQDEKLQPIPKLQAIQATMDFDIRGDEKRLFEEVGKVFGVRPVFDPQLELHPTLRFNINQVDFRTAMEALTAATDTFIFPVSQHDFYVAHDSELKRSELEPQVLLTFPLPNAIDQKDLIEAANVVRTELNLRTIGYDTATRVVMVRDRYSRATTARALLDALLLPKAQVSFEVQFLTYDSDRSFQYGISLPNSLNMINFLPIGHLQQVLPSSIASGTSFMVFGGGPYVGLSLATGASLFAMYSESHSSVIYDATVVVGDGQTANLHIGDKYPIPQTIYTGGTTGAASIYNPIGQVTLVDLGIVLKLTPRVNGDGYISLDLEASYDALGTQSIDTVPEINQRVFKGTVTLREGEWATVTGLDSKSLATSRSGLSGLSNVPILGQIFSQNTRDTTISDTLLVIKPTITRLPMSAEVSPQYYLGTSHGQRVLL